MKKCNYETKKEAGKLKKVVLHDAKKESQKIMKHHVKAMHKKNKH